MAFSKDIPLVSSSLLTAPPRIPPPSHRHAAPSGPWPWMDLESENDSESVDESEPEPETHATKCSHRDVSCRCWTNYPQSLFPNWTPRQVERSKMNKICAESEISAIHYIDVANNARFSKKTNGHTVCEEGKDGFWKTLVETRRSHDTCVRALFIENLSVPLMQMLGTKYNVEPFFFSSSVNWIPSRYQEEVRPGQGDHITITLTFLRSVKVRTETSARLAAVLYDVIDTQLPLPLPKADSHQKYKRFIHLDFLAIHMIRAVDSSTIISFHPTADRRTIIPSASGSGRRTTPASRLHSRVHLAGQSVYWQGIFQKSKDPTFILLTILWYALYAWDEGLEMLWEHICQLEASVITSNDINFTRELHKIRAHLLHYASLLQDFRKSVKFVLETPNPAMEAPECASWREVSNELMKKECNNLRMEIERLEMSRSMADKRLKNVMNLAFSLVNIDDSKQMRKLTGTAVRDSAAMKQISYLTMVFFPASLVAGLFGMNIREINRDSEQSLVHYIATALPMTAVTIWVIVAFQWRHEDGQDPPPLITRLCWPVTVLYRYIKARTRKDTSGKRNVGKLKSVVADAV